MKLEISENENRKEFTFSERVDWAKRLERIERIKAKERQGARTDITQNFAEGSKGESSNIVANESGFGNKETYRQAKYISENASEELIKQLDLGFTLVPVIIKEEVITEDQKLKKLYRKLNENKRR